MKKKGKNLCETESDNYVVNNIFKTTCEACRLIFKEITTMEDKTKDEILLSHGIDASKTNYFIYKGILGAMDEHHNQKSKLLQSEVETLKKALSDIRREENLSEVGESIITTALNNQK